ncbi:dTDP-glucose 4,6-dehydratase [Olleya sp. Bg11-27]|uniref:dTDP-glucose 4,6-dehydratase n=1 Tax=Olleya sp. Bg11-27 TaxID=2058135 RepID=UPI000C302903|nr:dTDP-glucose 4,6-dehydratase [Olleya sp. Bg11-27]AUC75894.1 dTDP-glucose 4,6-dehydratase [Olleya sp. Bg11-27]
MNKRISILGCGWLGLTLAIELISKGYRVYGSTTSIIKIKELESKGIKPFIIDIDDNNINISDFLFSDVLIIAIPSKNISAIKNLIKRIEKSEVRKVLFVSSTSVYPNTNAIITEESDTNNSILVAIENLFKTNLFFQSTIIRFGGLFGYDRKPGNFIKSGRKIENPEGYINFIHRDDCIGIIEHVIMKDTWNNVLNACTDSHPKRREFYLKEAKKLEKPGVIFNEKSENNYKIINSQKLKDLLDYDFKHKNLMAY